MWDYFARLIVFLESFYRLYGLACVQCFDSFVQRDWIVCLLVVPHMIARMMIEREAGEF